MKSEKSKQQLETPKKQGLPSLMKVFQAGEQKHPEMTNKELRMQAEERTRRKSERIAKIMKGIGKFFTILFIMSVIVSMVLVPLLIVFG